MRAWFRCHLGASHRQPVEVEMSERGFLVPIRPPAPPGPGQPHEGVLSAISELADHVRAYGFSRADELLTELLAVLYTEPGTGGSSHAPKASRTHTAPNES